MSIKFKLCKVIRSLTSLRCPKNKCIKKLVNVKSMFSIIFSSKMSVKLDEGALAWVRELGSCGFYHRYWVDIIRMHWLRSCLEKLKPLEISSLHYTTVYSDITDATLPHCPGGNQMGRFIIITFRVKNRHSDIVSIDKQTSTPCSNNCII